MDHPRVSNDEMLSRIVRFDQLQGRGIPLMFIDSVLPSHQRMNFALIGDTASENTEFSPIISAPHRFQIGMVKARPGNGPAYHTHDYVESFLVLSGRWRFYWGNDPDPAAFEGESMLEQWDYISLPPGVWRGFEVAADEAEEAWIFAVLEEHEAFTSKDPYWSSQIIEQAAEYGFHADESGKMIKPDNYDEIRSQLLAEMDGGR